MKVVRFPRLVILTGIPWSRVVVVVFNFWRVEREDGERGRSGGDKNVTGNEREVVSNMSNTVTTSSYRRPFRTAWTQAYPRSRTMDH